MKEAGLVNSSLVVIELGKVESQKENIKLRVVWKESDKSNEIHAENIVFEKDTKISDAKLKIIEKFDFDRNSLFRLRLADAWQEADKVICDEHFTLEKFSFKDGDTLFFEEGPVPKKGK